MFNFLIKLLDTLSTGSPPPLGPPSTAGNDVVAAACYPLLPIYALAMVKA